MKLLLPLIAVSLVCTAAALTEAPSAPTYRALYDQRLRALADDHHELITSTDAADISTMEGSRSVLEAIEHARRSMKAADLWTRYLDPLSYKRINGPLPVEWETEVFEKYERPYKRDGAGLTLAALYLEEPNANKDSLLQLVNASLVALGSYSADSITKALETHDHFFLCNRLFLLNLAAIYTTAFECPDTAQVVPELRAILASTEAVYDAFNTSFPATPLTQEYMERYRATIAFARSQSSSFVGFDRYTFLREHVCGLFALNQVFITNYHVHSRSYMDYSLTKSARSLFGKDLYTGQDAKGVFRRVTDPDVLMDIDHLGKSLFFDPLLSHNNQRSCASCHRADMCFTDTTRSTAAAFDHLGSLPRNTPSLVNADFNHLLMQDGKHISLQAQGRDVITNAIELGSDEAEVMRKVLSCPDYRNGFKALLPFTPQEPTLTLEHILSAITLYYTKFSTHRSPFDEAMDGQRELDVEARAGFNVFMGKAQCATCHFPPQFNGVKPPYIGSEFEVIGVPQDHLSAALSSDVGRFGINPAKETKNAFRTGGLRNIARTAPYMHNGAFRTLTEVIDFYDAGGGAGHGLDVPNQTLSSDSLHLTPQEKRQLEVFLRSLNEDLPIESPPTLLPASKSKELNPRKPGGEY